MNDFRPTLSGLAPGFTQEAPPTAALTEEQLAMATVKQNAARVLRVIERSGGSMTGEELRLALDGSMDAGERKVAVKHLRETRQVLHEGNTRAVVYTLPGKQPKPPPAPPTTTAVEPVDVAPGACTPSRTAPELTGDATILLSVPLVEGVATEIRLMAALDFVVANVSANDSIDSLSIERATAWLASKHRCAA
jgi:hypothetical protein